MSLPSSAASLDCFASGDEIAPAGGAFGLTTTAKKTKKTTPLEGSGGS